MDTAKFKLSNDSAYGGAVCYVVYEKIFIFRRENDLQISPDLL